jgi:hypothetical protein
VILMVIMEAHSSFVLHCTFLQETRGWVTFDRVHSYRRREAGSHLTAYATCPDPRTAI